MSGRTSKRLLILGVIVTAVILGVFWHTVRLVNRVEYLRWCASRSKVVSHLGSRVLTYAKARGGRLPQDWSELIEHGIVAAGELKYEGPSSTSRSIKICRTLRPIPTIDASDNLILIVESYEPPQGTWTVYLLNGIAEMDASNGAYALRRDNEQRVKCGLAPLPVPACGGGSAESSRETHLNSPSNP